VGRAPGKTTNNTAVFNRDIANPAIGLINKKATMIGISHNWYIRPGAKGKLMEMYVKAGFSAIAKAAKTIVNESFLVFKLFLRTVVEYALAI